MSCLECKHWNIRGAAEIDKTRRSEYGMAKQGFGLCNEDARWVYRPPQYRCNSFAADDGAKVLKRIEWLRKINKLTNENDASVCGPRGRASL